MKTLSRMERAKHAWDTLMIALEIADFVTRGGVVRTLHNANRPKTFETKRPAEYTIKVKSERPEGVLHHWHEGRCQECEADGSWCDHSHVNI